MKVYDHAFYGNMKAAKIFFEATEPKRQCEETNIQNQQNNFIEINGSAVSKEQIQQLPIEKQKQIEQILQLVSG